MGAEFVTFDNAVNAMPLLCHVLYEGAAYMAVLKNFLCLFYYLRSLRIIRRADYRAEITVNDCHIFNHNKSCTHDPTTATNETKYGKSILQVPDTGMSQYWSILEHFWCTSIALKCDTYVL